MTEYPFADMIVNGRLADISSFSNFRKNEVFIFCNFRPEGKCRPDLMAFSLQGDVLLVEGKQRKRDQENYALKNLITGIKELEKYSNLLRGFSRKSSQNAFESWNTVYQNCYVTNKKHGLALQAEVSEIDWPLQTQKSDPGYAPLGIKPYAPDTIPVLELIQFCYKNIAKPVGRIVPHNNRQT